MALQVTIKDDKLVIVCDIETPRPSATGKTLVVASTHGNVPTPAVINGQTVYVGVNAYIRKT